MTNANRVFVEEYLQCWNATEAYSKAYPDATRETARRNGSDLLTKTDIQSAVQKRLAKKAMPADEVLARLALHARGDLSPFLTSDGAGIDLTTDEAKASLCLIKKVKTKSRSYGKDSPVYEVETEIELHDPQAALVHIGRHLKLFTDKTELTGKDGEPLLKGYVGITPDQWDEPEAEIPSPI